MRTGIARRSLTDDTRRPALVSGLRYYQLKYPVAFRIMVPKMTTTRELSEFVWEQRNRQKGDACA